MELVIIKPRPEVTAQRIKDWMEKEFQQPWTFDDGNNPLVNATISVVNDA